MSDSSIEMKQKSPCTAKFKANGVLAESLPNDYLCRRLAAAKKNLRQREIRGQKLCHRADIRRRLHDAVRNVETSFRGETLWHFEIKASSQFSHCKDLLPKMRFIEFSLNFSMQFCVPVAQGSRNFCHTRQLT